MLQPKEESGKITERPNCAAKRAWKRRCRAKRAHPFARKALLGYSFCHNVLQPRAESSMTSAPIPFPSRRVSGFDEPPAAKNAGDARPKGLPPSPGMPTALQRAWLARGLGQPGGKLPMFGPEGRAVDPRTVKACLDKGWCEPWYANPLKPDWLVCKLTVDGRRLFEAG
jgi:hypothetical protein